MCLSESQPIICLPCYAETPSMKIWGDKAGQEGGERGKRREKKRRVIPGSIRMGNLGLTHGKSGTDECRRICFLMSCVIDSLMFQRGLGRKQGRLICPED